jgi:DNA-binding response OmpR family regulator
VLVIEADDPYSAAMAACIHMTGGRVDCVASPDSAVTLLEGKRYDALVWGVASGAPARQVEVISELRRRSEAPLVVIDGGDDVAQLNLEAGADQWLPKPFVPGVLVGALRAVLRRRTVAHQVGSRLEVRGLLLDRRARRLAVAGSEVSLTRQEWDLLVILLAYPNRYLSAREIIRLGWHAGDRAPEQVRTYVHRLRDKLKALKPPCQLESRHGLGYCLSFE